MRKYYLLLIIICCTPLLIFSQTQQIENPGFELWEDAGTVIDEPVDWSSMKTSDSPLLSSAAPVVWGRSDDAHSGNYSAYIYNVYIELISSTASGLLTNGMVHSTIVAEEGYAFTNATDPQWHTPFHSRPDSLVGWFKCNPIDGDFGGIRAILHVDEGKLPAFDTQDNWIAEANHFFPDYVVDTWTRFSVPFEYYSDNNSTYLLIVIKSGNGVDAIADSELWIDDLEMIYNDPGGIDDLDSKDALLYYHDGYLNIKTLGPDLKRNGNIQLYDMGGNLISEHRITGNRISLNSNMVKGIYIAKITVDSKIIVQKFYYY